ncbi:MAG: MFS transporter [Ferruginibacter sp.]
METITVQDTILKERSASFYRTILFAICFISTALGGTVSTLMSVYLPVAVKDLLGERSVQEMNDISGYINALFIFGWAFGGVAWGIISDRIGRKKSMLLAIASYGIFTVLTGLMPNWWGVIIFRFLSGFGVGGVLVTTLILISEVWPLRSKAIFIGILSIAFPVGIFSAGLINYLISSWRFGFLIGFVPLTIALAGILLLKESGIWKAHHAEKTKAGAIKMSLFTKEHRREIIIGSLTFGSMLIGLWAIFSWLPTWIQSLITTTDAQKERGLSMMFLGIGGLSGGFLSGWLVNLAGVRKSMLMCFSICTVLSFILFKTNLVFSNIIYVEIAALALFFGASQGVLSVYIPQLFPTGIRATATGFCFNIGRLFTASAVLFIGILVTKLGGFGNAIFMFSLVFVIGLIVVLFTGGQQKSELGISLENKESLIAAKII